MKRRINFSGRKKIQAEDIRIRLSEAPSDLSPSFSAEVKLPAGLPTDARVYVEPYHRSSSMRFDFGTVGAPHTPADLQLTDIDRSSGVLFRVKVVDESASVGKIIAAASRIRPVKPGDEQGKKALLPLVSKDLGEEIWRLQMEGAAPELQINNRIPGFRDRLMSDVLLQGAVFPQALAAVLTKLLGTGEYDDDEQWVQDWKAFAATLYGKELPDDLAEEDDGQLALMVEEVVTRFCQMYAFATNARKETEQTYND